MPYYCFYDSKYYDIKYVYPSWKEFTERRGELISKWIKELKKALNQAKSFSFEPKCITELKINESMNSKDFTFIKKFDNLKFLTLSGKQISYISIITIITENKKLEKIELVNSSVNNISSLTKFKELNGVNVEKSQNEYIIRIR